MCGCACSLWGQKQKAEVQALSAICLIWIKKRSKSFYKDSHRRRETSIVGIALGTTTVYNFHPTAYLTYDQNHHLLKPLFQWLGVCNIIPLYQCPFWPSFSFYKLEFTPTHPKGLKRETLRMAEMTKYTSTIFEACNSRGSSDPQSCSP